MFRKYKLERRDESRKARILLIYDISEYEYEKWDKQHKFLLFYQ